MAQPWFKFFASDYLLDPSVDTLPLDAQAVLLRMWCLCHLEGSCPADSGEIARKARLSLPSVLNCREQLAQFFDERGGRLFSRRMVTEKEKSEAARASANRRWDTGDGNRIANRNAIRNAQSQSQSQTEVVGCVETVEFAENQPQPQNLAIEGEKQTPLAEGDRAQIVERGQQRLLQLRKQRSQKEPEAVGDLLHHAEVG